MIDRIVTPGSSLHKKEFGRVHRYTWAYQTFYGGKGQFQNLSIRNHPTFGKTPKLSQHQLVRVHNFHVTHQLTEKQIASFVGYAAHRISKTNPNRVLRFASLFNDNLIPGFKKHWEKKQDKEKQMELFENDD